MTNTPATYTTTHPAFAALSVEARQHITFDLIVARLTAPGTYGYDLAAARDTADRIVATRSAGWIAAFIGEAEGCSNCGELATRNGRCNRCRNLPSDLD